MPKRAAALKAATIAVGVARMNAQGQATMRMVITRLRSWVKPQTRAAMISTSGV